MNVKGMNLVYLVKSNDKDFTQRIEASWFFTKVFIIDYAFLPITDKQNGLLVAKRYDPFQNLVKYCFFNNVNVNGMYDTKPDISQLRYDDRLSFLYLDLVKDIAKDEDFYTSLAQAIKSLKAVDNEVKQDIVDVRTLYSWVRQTRGGKYPDSVKTSKLSIITKYQIYVDYKVHN
jgi:hypothetical protein